MEYERSSSNHSEMKTSGSLFRSAIPAWGFRSNWRNRYSTRSLQPNPRAPVWGFASAGQSLSLIAGACGRSVPLGTVQLFTLVCHLEAGSRDRRSTARGNVSADLSRGQTAKRVPASEKHTTAVRTSALGRQGPVASPGCRMSPHDPNAPVASDRFRSMLLSISR
jgi:hypothetical protein